MVVWGKVGVRQARRYTVFRRGEGDERQTIKIETFRFSITIYKEGFYIYIYNIIM